MRWYDRKITVILLLLIFFPVGIFALWKNTSFSRTTKIVLMVVVGLIVLGILFEVLSYHQGSVSEDNSPVGRWTYDDAGGWHFELRIFKNGRYLIEGPIGTDLGLWTAKDGIVNFYLEGVAVAQGYRRGDYFYYDAGQLGSMRMVKR